MISTRKDLVKFSFHFPEAKETSQTSNSYVEFTTTSQIKMGIKFSVDYFISPTVLDAAISHEQCTQDIYIKKIRTQIYETLMKFIKPLCPKKTIDHYIDPDEDDDLIKNIAQGFKVHLEECDTNKATYSVTVAALEILDEDVLKFIRDFQLAKVCSYDINALEAKAEHDTQMKKFERNMLEHDLAAAKLRNEIAKLDAETRIINANAELEERKILASGEQKSSPVSPNKLEQSPSISFFS